MLILDTQTTTIVEKISQIPCTDEQVILLLIGEHTPIDVNALLAELNQHQITVVGGIFTGVIYGQQKYDSGIIAVPLPILTRPTIIKGLDTPHFKIERPHLYTQEQPTALVLVDGLANYIARFLDKLYQQFGNQINYIGGGAGSLSFEQMPCVFDNDGIYQNAALVVWLNITTQLGVRHGWRDLVGPRIATRTEGTIVHELDGRPAFQIYSRLIEQLTGKKLTQDNFFDIAKEYPLGIFHVGVDRIVRDPIAVTDKNELICVGEVPLNSMVYILQGDKQHLIAHAQQATLEAIHDDTPSQHYFVVDCISRVLYLENDFDQELESISQALPPDAPTPFGILSLGEIASYGTGRVEFFNKTIVVGAMQNCAS